MKTILFKDRKYAITILGCFMFLIISSFLSAYLLPSRPVIDFQTYYGSGYIIYISLNWIMLVSFCIMFIFMGLLIAERIIRIRGYYEILQKEITGKKEK